jgi:hypothetical protein
MRRACLIVFLFLQWCLSTPIYAQDTISLFYATAKFRLTEDHQQQLTNFLEWQELTLLDSIQIIGVADSSGNVVSNERLSLKRASQVQHFLMNKSIVTPMRLLAKGEDPMVSNAMSKQRRVDILFFYNKAVIADDLELEEKLIDDEFCYVLADSFLLACNQTIIQKGKKEYVQLEMEPSFYSDSLRLYSVSEDDKTRLPVLHLVKWKSVTTGESWWLSQRYIATIKKSDFDRFRLVMKSNIPCDSLANDCGFRLSDQDIQLNNNMQLDVAVFLMNNLRIKQRFFNKRKLRIEVPRKFIDLNKVYYFGLKKIEISWHTRKGKRHQKYYYADVKMDGKNSSEFTIYTSHVGSCFVQQITGGSQGLKCRITTDNSSSIGFEIGDRNAIPSHLGYLGLYAKHCWDRSEVNLLLALDTDWDPFLSARFDYHFIGVNKSGFSVKPIVYSGRWFCLYGGTTLNVVLQNAEQLMSNHDVHLGIDVTNYSTHRSFQRIYLEGGPMIQYTALSQPIQPQFRLGVQFGL